MSTPVGRRPRAAPSGRRRSAGWLPRQHGAWAMLVVPFVAGAWLAGPAWVHLPLAVFWLVGYLAFHATGRWLRTRRAQDRTPMVVHGATSGVLGVLTLAVAPHLLWWAPVFVPLLVVSLWATARGAERSLGNDAVTVVAASLMAPVAFAAGDGSDWARLWVTAAVLLAYLLGTVLYVKTMIRERGRRSYLVASAGYRAAGVVGASWLVTAGWQHWALVVVWVALLARAVGAPTVNTRRGRPLRPVVVGVGEIVASLVVLATALAAA